MVESPTLKPFRRIVLPIHGTPVSARLSGPIVLAGRERPARWRVGGAISSLPAFLASLAMLVKLTSTACSPRLDGAVSKRSWAGEVRSVSLLVAIGVPAQGYREILGICEGAKEDSPVGVPRSPQAARTCPRPDVP